MIHVFIGPTLDRDEPLLAAPAVRVLDPIRHGDLFDPAIETGDTVVIIDGLYHQTPALRHKEILAAIDRGVRVVGAASIGALRAAELHPYGMTGIGEVYQAYRDGTIDGDDEVAVGQDPGAGHALTWPLVNLRSLLRRAEDEGLATAKTVEGLLDAWAGVYYPQRTTAAVLAVCRQTGAAHVGYWLQQRLRADRHFGNVKRQDALEAVRWALAVWPPARSAERAGVTWDTGYFRQWSGGRATRVVDGLTLHTALRLTYRQLFDPQFATTWTAWLDHRSRCAAPGEPGKPVAERLARLTGDTTGALPAWAVYRPLLDLNDQASLDVLLARETNVDRATIARYGQRNAELTRTRPGFRPEAIADGLACTALLDVWKTGPDALDREAMSRGMRSGQHAVEAMKFFLTGFLDDVRAARGLAVADVR